MFFFVFFCFFFFDKFAMKNNLQNKMQITYVLMTGKNIDSDHVCHVIVNRFCICARDCDV